MGHLSPYWQTKQNTGHGGKLAPASQKSAFVYDDSLFLHGLSQLLAGGCVSSGRSSPLLADMCFGFHPGEYDNTSALSLALAFREHLGNFTKFYREEIASTLNKA